MTSSDIIAIVAIAASTIVSITSAYISYQNNKANLLAKKSEIAFEKRLDAFRDVVNGVAKHVDFLYRWSSREVKSEKEFKAFAQEFDEVNEHIITTYRRCVVYLPPSIDAALVELHRIIDSQYSESWPQFSKGKLSRDVLNSWLASVGGQQKKIVEMIQQFVGL
jgi:Zn-finger domain-containing protein